MPLVAHSRLAPCGSPTRPVTGPARQGILGPPPQSGPWAGGGAQSRSVRFVRSFRNGSTSAGAGRAKLMLLDSEGQPGSILANNSSSYDQLQWADPAQ